MQKYSSTHIVAAKTNGTQYTTRFMYRRQAAKTADAGPLRIKIPAFFTG
jgi:hypothetical protein